MAKRKSTLERFESYAEPIPECGCWIWTGAVFNDGYGAFRRPKFTERAHRTAWWLYFGKIPKGALVLHKCDIPLCVNPEHLFLGTQKDNCSDAQQKRRHSHGEKHGMHRLTEVDVLEVLAAKRAGETGVAIAKRFDVTTTTISAIWTGRSWKYVSRE